MADDLEKKLKKNWKKMFVDIADTRISFDRISKKYGLNGQLEDYCYQKIGATPDELRARENIGNIEKMLLNGKTKHDVQEYFKIKSNSITKAFKHIYKTTPNQRIMRLKTHIYMKQIEKMLIDGMPIPIIKKELGIDSTALNYVFREVHSMDAKDYAIQGQAKQCKGYLRYTGKSKYDPNKGRRKSPLDRYGIKLSHEKKLPDTDA